MISKRGDESGTPERVAVAWGAGRKPSIDRQGEESRAATSGQTKSEDHQLMERVVERGNLWSAYERVVRNKGAAGVDDLPVSELKSWLKVHWPRVKQALLEGRYIPRPVRRVDIPKPQGGVRTLGIPTVLDRLIQQALHQVMQPLFEPTFSQGSFGFRAGRNAHQAVRRAQSYIQDGKRWVVDIDLEKFFDRVNHDVLMSRVARCVHDERVLKVIRRFLEAGIMSEGLVSPRTEGTPQGGPLSPLLSNILLTDLDQEIERRGLSFCRYADDCNIYVSSRTAGNRVMEGIRVFLEKALHLKLNPEKSAVARPWERKFLGYSFTMQRQSRIRIAPASVQRLMQKIREQMRTGRGRSLAGTIVVLNPLLRGWINYFKLSQTPNAIEGLDTWLRHRLRCLLWRQWKRVYTRFQRLRRLGLPVEQARRSAFNGRGPWWNAGAKHMVRALPPDYFTRLGLLSLVAAHQRLQSLA
jgi:RNA-directed DNA polymerase